MHSAVSRATPSLTLSDQCMPPASPMLSSRLPPPRSRQRAGAGSSTIDERTAWKISRASSRPPITRTCTPSSCSIRSTTSAELPASRIAAVAPATNSSAPRLSATALKFRTVSSTVSCASAVMRPVFDTTSPRRSISFSRTSVSNDPSGFTCTISRWNEFDPRSAAAIRTALTLRERRRRSGARATTVNVGAPRYSARDEPITPGLEHPGRALLKRTVPQIEPVIGLQASRAAPETHRRGSRPQWSRPWRRHRRSHCIDDGGSVPSANSSSTWMSRSNIVASGARLATQRTDGLVASRSGAHRSPRTRTRPDACALPLGVSGRSRSSPSQSLRLPASP